QMRGARPGACSRGLLFLLRTPGAATGAVLRPRCPHGERRVPLLQQESELSLEVGQLLEVLVDAGEAQVGHVIELPEAAEHLDADLLGGDHWPLAPKLLLDPGGELRDLFPAHRAVLDRLGHARLDLGPVERLLLPVTLDDREAGHLDALERRVPAAAGQALTAAPDRRTGVRGPRVDDLVLEVAAPWTSHRDRSRGKSGHHNMWWLSEP